MSKTSLAVVRSSWTKFSPWSLVFWLNCFSFFSSLYSSSVVGMFPGAIIWTGTKIYGRVLTAKYCSKALSLANYFSV